MNNTQQELKCADLVQDKFNQTEQTYQEANDFFNQYDNATEGEQIALKVIDKHKGDYFHEYEDFFDYINNTALSWDYVEGEDENNSGFYRLQLSWGGPSDEFRIYTIGDTLDIDCIDYHYMDWFDGASIPVLENTASFDVCQMFLDCEVA
jgi:hypothetical protein